MSILETRNLIDYRQTIAAPLLERVRFPWEVLPQIGEFLLQLGPSLPPEEYEQVGDGIWIARSARIASTACLCGPLIVGKKLSVSSILEKIGRLGTALSAYTERLIFSFLDPYKKAMNKLHAIDPSFRPPTNEEETALAEGIARLNSFWPQSLSLATCAETADFEKLGIQHAACIDPSLLLRINPEDSDLAKLYAGTRQCHFPGAFSATRLYIKDSGQRKLCNCAPSKDIGAYGTCPHMCTYCYANTSSARTLRFFTAHDSDSSLLI